MNFNVIVGNPPYSNSVGGGTGDQGATALFNEFMNAAIDMAEYSKEDCVISMITPTKWIAGLGDKNIVAARKRMIEGNHLRYFVDYLDSRNCFRGVSIAGGVSYWLWDKNYNGLTKWTTVNNSYESEAVERDLKEFDIIHRIPLADSIIEKVQAKSTDYMDRYISRNEWGYGTNCWYQYDYPKKRKNETDIRLVTRQGNLYIPKKRIMAEDIYYKVIFSRAVADATALPNDKGKYRILTSIQILKPGEIASASYMGVTKINLYEGACNIKKYFETKFVRFLILQRLYGIGLTEDRFRYVPLMKFYKEWTDQDLYEYFDLNIEEINCIEELIDTIGTENEPKSNADIEVKNASYVRSIINK